MLITIVIAVLIQIPFYIILLILQNKTLAKLKAEFEKICDEAEADAIRTIQELEQSEHQLNKFK